MNRTTGLSSIYFIDCKPYEKALELQQSLDFMQLYYLYKVSESRLECIDIGQS